MDDVTAVTFALSVLSATLNAFSSGTTYLLTLINMHPFYVCMPDMCIILDNLQRAVTGAQAAGLPFMLVTVHHFARPYEISTPSCGGLRISVN